VNWYCPNCGLRETTAPKPNRFHVCAKLRGLTAPMLPEKVAGKVELNEREDYVGKERVFLDRFGRPVMNITTTRDNGQDAIVFAPTAVARGSME
jgi:hypothetical protein